MKKIGAIVFICWMFFAQLMCAQNTCVIMPDTLILEETKTAIYGVSIEAKLKKHGELKLFKADNGKLYLHFLVTQNLYFDKRDNLEIESDGRSILFKNVLHQKYDKYTGLYVVEVWKNYIVTLKDDGLSSLTFVKAKTKFYPSESKLVKQIADCFYQEINIKK